MLVVFYTVAVVNIGCREGKNCGRLVAVAFVTIVLAFNDVSAATAMGLALEVERDGGTNLPPNRN
jgi:hypothetical protein